MNKDDNFKGAALMSISMLGFTLSDMGWKLLAPFVPLSEFLFVRGIFIVTFLYLLLRYNGHLISQGRGGWLLITLRSVIEVLITYCVLISIQHVAFADLTALLQTVPLVMTLAAFFVYGERFGMHRIMAILVGFIGVLMITRPGFQNTNIHYLLLLAGVLLIVMRDMISRRLPRTVPNVLAPLIAALFVGLTNGIGVVSHQWVALPFWLFLAIGVVAIATCFGHVAIVAAMRVGEVNFTAAFRYSAIVFAIIVDMLVFKDHPDLWTVLGSVLVATAGIYTLRRENLSRNS